MSIYPSCDLNSPTPPREAPHPHSLTRSPGYRIEQRDKLVHLKNKKKRTRVTKAKHAASKASRATREWYISCVRGFVDHVGQRMGVQITEKTLHRLAVEQGDEEWRYYCGDGGNEGNVIDRCGGQA